MNQVAYPCAVFRPAAFRGYPLSCGQIVGFNRIAAFLVKAPAATRLLSVGGFSADNFDHALEIANNTEYGLANSVWTSDLTRAARVAEGMMAANSWINAHNVFPHGVPYGGIKKSGMGGGVNSMETLLDYWRCLSVVRPLS